MLGIDWIKILIHFVVFAVLAVGLYLLLYKPVLRFIRNRQEIIQKDIDKGAAMQEEGQAVKAEYDRKMEEIAAERDQLLAEADRQREVMLEEARKQAAEDGKAIKEAAERQAQAAREAQEAELQHDAGRVAVDLATEILGREISQEDNERLIAECLKAWSDHD